MLTLPIKRKWFDMILSGEKKEEYRDITPYYEERLGKYMNEGLFQIILRAGYRKDSPKMICTALLNKGGGIPSWGAERGKKYFVLHIYDPKLLHCPNCGAKMDAKRDDECTDCERDCTMCGVRFEKED